MNSNRKLPGVLPFVLGLAALIAALAWLRSGLDGGPASATHTVGVWTHVASACAVDEASFNRYDQHVSDFKHKGTSTGQIVARCNVVALPSVEPAVGTQVLEATFLDPDGAGAAYRVQVQLIRARKSDGANLVVAQLDSNNFPGGGLQTQFEGFVHHFDFIGNAYYVQLRVTRADSLKFPLVVQVRLTGVIF